MPRIEGTEQVPNLYRPVLIVSLTLAGKTSKGPAVVDSGADRTILPGEIVEAFGVGFSSLPLSGENSLGAGGAFETRTGSGEVRWREYVICEEFLVAAPGTLPFALLGREDFFKRFQVRFSWHHKPPSFQIDSVTKAEGKITTVTAKKPGRRRR